VTDQPRLIAATARLSVPRKPTKAQRLRQHRQAEQWRKAAKTGDGESDSQQFESSE
jgi:hypothetical protein